MKEFIRNKIRENLVMENRVQMDIPIPQDIIAIKNVFVKNGHKLYVVGGAVRDAILGKSPKDWDLATDAVPDKVESMMKKVGLRTLPTGKAFGVINVFTDDDEYEIATFRKDIGSGRRPDEVEFTNIETDVKRRDLTINALFYDIDSNEVVDLVGGISDLRNGIVKTVGAPEDRFAEDRLRILRAIRFAGRFGSDLDPAVDKALKKDAKLDGVSPERIREEFLKGLRTAKSVIHFLTLLDRYNLWGEVFKGIESINKKFVEERSPAVLLAWMFFGTTSNKLDKDLNKLTYTSNEVKAITFLTALSKFDPKQIVAFKKLHMKSGVSDEEFRRFGALITADKKFIESFLEFKLSVSGQDAMDAGVKAGPEMGQFINAKEIENFQRIYK